MMIVAVTWQAVGVNALLFVVGLQSIPGEPLEAARLDGAEGFSLFRHHLWPQLRPITTVVIGLSIVGSLKTFDVVWVMTQGGPGTSSETLALSVLITWALASIVTDWEVEPTARVTSLRTTWFASTTMPVFSNR